MSRFTQDGAVGPSQRQLRVGEIIRHALSEILSRNEIMDPELKGIFITVPEVRMSPDLKHATVLVMPLGGKKQEQVPKILDRHARFLRGQLGRRIALKFTPDLIFRLDSRFEDDTRVTTLLKSDEVARDLGADEPAAGAGDEANDR
ncbi:MAG: 30S ribosome-binding factor RbfA [Hyphomicrobiaceae bacterium]|nr:30S ribosome-binding factor RbfA [Hyphomicrobiaceae bacterium]